MEHPNTPDFSGLSQDLVQEWHRVQQTLEAKGFIQGREYPVLDSVRRNPKDPVSRSIDHTLLKQDAPRDSYLALFTQAREWDTWSVCVPPNRVPLGVEHLSGSRVQVCTVVGFPFGYDSTEAKVRETLWSIQQGAREIDMVIPVGMVKDNNLPYVFEDIRAVVDAAQGNLVKVILEVSELSPAEIVRASALSCFAGAHFIKTSTGFASGGANLDALTLMRRIAGDSRGVKASGGVKTREFALQCLSIGVDRIGASSTAAILGLESSGGGGY